MASPDTPSSSSSSSSSGSAGDPRDGRRDRDRASGPPADAAPVEPVDAELDEDEDAEEDPFDALDQRLKSLLEPSSQAVREARVRMHREAAGKAAEGEPIDDDAAGDGGAGGTTRVRSRISSTPRRAPFADAAGAPPAAGRRFTPTGSGGGSGNVWQMAGQMYAAGWEVVGAMLGLGLVGYGCDFFFRETAIPGWPTITGLLLGLIGGLYNASKRAMLILGPQKKKRPAPQPPSRTGEAEMTDPAGPPSEASSEAEPGRADHAADDAAGRNT